MFYLAEYILYNAISLLQNKSPPDILACSAHEQVHFITCTRSDRIVPARFAAFKRKEPCS